MHLPQYHCCTLSCHVAWPHTMLHTVCSIGILPKDAYAATRERNDESSVTKTIELTPER